MKGDIDYEKIMKMLNKLSHIVASRHRDDIIGDALLIICTSDLNFTSEKKIKRFVRRSFMKSKNNYFNKLLKRDIPIGGYDDIAELENEEGTYL